MGNVTELKKELNALADPRQAEVLQRFFKTGKGEYGEGDVFLGIKVPVQRKVAKKYNSMAIKEISSLLKSNIHEHRLVSLFILINMFSKADAPERKKVYEFYLKNTRYINNWDLVDLSAPKIAGVYLLDRPKDILYKLAASKILWERRIAVLSTFTFIKNGGFNDTLKLAETLLHDEHDLIHKAVGWMLREIGKRDQGVEEAFLKKHHKTMPRTMLRYSIERFEETKRKFYMSKK